jgi:hypothetical protein
MPVAALIDLVLAKGVFTAEHLLKDPRVHLRRCPVRGQLSQDRHQAARTDRVRR